MTFREAQEEFAVRHYLWAREESRMEVERGFPLLKRMDISICRRYLRRMAQLSPEDQRAFSTLLVKRFHPQAMKLLGEEALTGEEVAEIKRYTAGHAVELDPVEEAFSQRQLAGDPTTKLDRKRFKKIAKECLTPVLGHEDGWGGGGTWRYVKPVGNLEVQTYLDTGGTHHQLCYSHRIIFSGHQTLIEQTSVMFWLGLGGGATYWHDLEDSKAEATAHLLAELCDHFLEVAPRLLKGIAP